MACDQEALAFLHQMLDEAESFKGGVPGKDILDRVRVVIDAAARGRELARYAATVREDMSRTQNHDGTLMRLQTADWVDGLRDRALACYADDLGKPKE